MAPSQLKQLKASLREGGILAPQKSKKQRKTTNRDANARQKRNAALECIREKFNPFEVKAPSRTPKYDISSNRPTKNVVERPGVTRGLGEERRRATLLKELQSRNKVGGMNDRRFGEDDPNMTPEQKAAERFARQAMRVGRKNDTFNLEDDGDYELTLTHGGRALDFDGRTKSLKDDFDESVSGSDAEDFDAADDRPRKRLRLDGSEAEDMNEDLPERKKTKNEVMQEVMAKSKAYKAARQAQKEDDEELRAELDSGLGNLFTALTKQKHASRQQLPSPPITDSEPTMDPSRAAILAGKSREEAEKEYEANVRQLKLEARSKPTVRTKTDEEKAAEEKTRLEELERERLRRMRGEPESSEDEDTGDGVEIDALDDEMDDAEAFGLEQPQPRYVPQLEVEDEDQFVMDDIIASDSEADLASDFEDNDSTTLEGPGDDGDDGDDDFINGLVLPQRPSLPISMPKTASIESPYTFPCPQDLSELKDVTKDISAEELPIVVQRIRALYHKGLAEGNNAKLGKFAQAMVFWVVALVNHDCQQKPSMQTIEQLLRHLHSMAKAQPLEVATALRQRLREIAEEDQGLTPGDLILLTSVSYIFPTSDQWHPVVTPAMLIMSKHLAQSTISDKVDIATGTFVCSLLLRYQTRSGRYSPEVVTYMCKAMSLLVTPKSMIPRPEHLPTLQEANTYHILKKETKPPASRLSFSVLQSNMLGSPNGKTEMSSESLLLGLLNLCIAIIDLYASKAAFSEMVAPLQTLLQHLSQPKNLNLLHQNTQAVILSLSKSLAAASSTAVASRKPLLLHNHRPLAIKSAYPLFSDNYNPERKQRDPDEERAELNKLRAEHKKERKGAMRELRKDANFMAREQLREKKAKDEAYEKKLKRLVAEIQGEEGHEAKAYEREKAKRKGRF